jgi:hypothetical protein
MIRHGGVRLTVFVPKLENVVPKLENVVPFKVTDHFSPFGVADDRVGRPPSRGGSDPLYPS